MGIGGSEGSGGVERGRGLPSAGTSWHTLQQREGRGRRVGRERNS